MTTTLTRPKTHQSLTNAELHRQVAFDKLGHLAAGLDPRDMQYLDVNPEVVGLIPRQQPTVFFGADGRPYSID